MGRGVKIPISFQKDQAEADVKEFKEELEKSMKSAQAFGLAAREAFDALRASLERALEFMREAVSVSAEQERQETRTLAALQLHTRNALENLEVLQAQNEARRNWTAVSNTQQLQLEATALELGVEAKHLKEVLDATVNLSSATGKDLGASLISVVKLYEGNTKALERMGIQVMDVHDGFQRLLGMSSVTASAMDTFSGQVSILKSNFEELLIALGNAIVRNDDVGQFLFEVNMELKNLLHEVIENGPAMKERVSEIVHELRELGTWIKDHKDDIAEMIHLFSLASKVKIAASVASAGGGLARSVAGTAAASGVGGFLGGAAMSGLGTVGAGAEAVGIGGALGLSGAALGAATLGIGVLGAGVGYLAWDHFRDKPEEQLNPDGGMEKHFPNPLFRKNAGFQFTPSTGPDVEDIDFSGAGEGSRFTKQDLEKYHEERLRNQKEAARKKKEQEEKEYHEYMHEVDLELEAYHERNRQIEKLQEEEIEAKIKWRKKLDEIDVERIKDATQRTTDLNTARLHGFKSVEEMYRYEEITGEKLESDARKIRNKKLLEEHQFWEDQSKTAFTGLSTVLAGMVKGFEQGHVDLEASAKQFFGGLLSQIGQTLVTLGTAAAAAATASLIIPITWPMTGGPAGIGAGLTLIGIGSALMGTGAFIGDAGSGGGGSGGTPSLPSSAVGSAGGYGSFGGSGFGGGYSGGSLASGGRPIAIVNVQIDGTKGLLVGNSAEVARYLADLLGGNAGMSFN